MKFQIFADYSFEELNSTINGWLNAVPGLDICHVTQSQLYDAEKGALTTISVFYTETTLGGIKPMDVMVSENLASPRLSSPQDIVIGSSEPTH